MDSPTLPPRTAATHRPRRMSRWRVRGALARHDQLFLAALGLALPIALWIGLATFGGIEKIFLPSPLDVVKRGHVWAVSENLWRDVWVSVYRVSAGFACSAVLALPLGLAAGTFRPLQALLEPLMDFVRYMPAVAFIPLVMLWIGIGEGAKMGIIFIGTFFQQVLMVAEDVRRVPLAQIEAAQTMGATRSELVRLVIWPAAKPALLDTLRVTLGWAWTYLVVAELVAANSGIGYAILKAQRFLQTDKIFFGILLIGFIGLVQDQVLRRLHRFLFPWLHR